MFPLFLEVEMCKPNPCHNNATCENDRIRFKCFCPNATEPDAAIVGQVCNESKILCLISSDLNYKNVPMVKVTTS